MSNLVRQKLTFVLISIAVWALVLILGTYDQEDIFHSLYSIGGFFGAPTKTIPEFSLTRTLLGVPVLDLGIVTGYRLPYQGTLHLGILWPLRQYLPTLYLAQMYVLLALLIGTQVFVKFATSWHFLGETQTNRRLKSAFCIASWLVLMYPVIEYLLQEDWFSIAIPYLGFVITMFSLSRAEIIHHKTPSPIEVARIFQMTLIGIHFILLGSITTMGMYLIPILILVGWRTRVFLKARDSLRNFKGLTLLLVLCVTSHALSIVMDVGSEIYERRDISKLSNWWANPARGFGATKHFVGQLISVENSWLVRQLNPEFIGRFNVPASGLGRLPLALVALQCGIVVCLVGGHSLRSRVGRWLWVVEALYLWLFLSMIEVAPYPLRLSSDYLMRDALIPIAITIAMVALGSTSELGLKSRSSNSLHRFQLAVVIYYSITVLVAPLTVVGNRQQNQQQALSPKSVMGSITNDSDWARTFESLRIVEFPTLAIVNTSVGDFPSSETKERSWRGLTGWHLFRQFGFRSTEGFPKIRSTESLNGQDGLKSRLIPPTLEICGSEVISLLKIDVILVDSSDVAACETRINDIQTSVTHEYRKLELPETGLTAFLINQRKWLILKSLTAEIRDYQNCGVITEPSCFLKFWRLSQAELGSETHFCEQGCLYKLDFRELYFDQGINRRLVLPLNTDVTLSAVSTTGESVDIESVNGFATIKLGQVSDELIEVNWRPDVRMYLYAIAAWLNFLTFLVFCLCWVIKKSRS